MLAPQAHTTCTAAVYTVTQADVDTGNVTNTATAAGTPPQGGEPVEDTRPRSSRPPLPIPASCSPNRACSTTPPARSPGSARSGSRSPYVFTVTNNGNVTVHGITVNDPTVGAVTCDDTTLAPAQPTTCRSVDPHTITQADVDRGGVDNTATAHGFGPPARRLRWRCRLRSESGSGIGSHRGSRDPALA